MKKLMVDAVFDSGSATEIFEKTFTLLRDELGDDSFKRYSTVKEKYEGQFSVSLFEFLTSGVASRVRAGESDESIRAKILSISKSIVRDEIFVAATRHGSRGINRFPKLIELSRSLFN
jgi:hypothetical protein